MEGLGYSEAKPLKVKVSTRNIAVYRDPAVILIDQLKKIYIDGELEVVDTSIWHAKVTREEYRGRPQPDRRRRRRSRRQPLRELQLQLGAQPHPVLQQGRRRADRQAVAGAGRRQAQADRLGDREEAGRGPGAADHHSTIASATCWQPQREGFRAAPQQHLQQLALRGRVARQVDRRASVLASRREREWEPISSADCS